MASVGTRVVCCELLSRTGPKLLGQGRQLFGRDIAACLCCPAVDAATTPIDAPERLWKAAVEHNPSQSDDDANAAATVEYVCSRMAAEQAAAALLYKHSAADAPGRSGVVVHDRHSLDARGVALSMSHEPDGGPVGAAVASRHSATRAIGIDVVSVPRMGALLARKPTTFNRWLRPRDDSAKSWLTPTPFRGFDGEAGVHTRAALLWGIREALVKATGGTQVAMSDDVTLHNVPPEPAADALASAMPPSPQRVASAAAAWEAECSLHGATAKRAAAGRTQFSTSWRGMRARLAAWRVAQHIVVCTAIVH